MIKKIAIPLIIISILSNAVTAAVDMSLISILKNNATIYAYININKIKEKPSFKWLTNTKSKLMGVNDTKCQYDSINASPSGSLSYLSINKRSLDYALIENVLKKNGYADSLDDIFLAVKTRTNKKMFSLRKEYSLAFALRLNKSITYEEVNKLLKQILPTESKENLKIKIINDSDYNKKVIVVELTKKKKFILTLLNNNKIIAGGDSAFIKILTDAEIDKNQMSDLERNNDIVINYTIPDEAKIELQKYANKLKYDKNALPIDISFLKDLKFIRTIINFSDLPGDSVKIDSSTITSSNSENTDTDKLQKTNHNKFFINFDSTLYLKNSKSLNTAKALSDQLLPLLKFQLLTTSKGKKLTIVDTIHVTVNNKNMAMNIKFDISENDINELRHK